MKYQGGDDRIEVGVVKSQGFSKVTYEDPGLIAHAGSGQPGHFAADVIGGYDGALVDQPRCERPGRIARVLVGRYVSDVPRLSSVHLGANGNTTTFRQLVNWTVNWSGRWKLAFAKPSVEDQWE